MSAVLPTPSPTPAAAEAWEPPADVLEYARQHNVEQCLVPLYELARRLFPTGELKVYMWQDHEDTKWVGINFEMHVPIADVPDYRAATRRWHEEAIVLEGRPTTASIGLSLRRHR